MNLAAQVNIGEDLPMLSSEENNMLGCIGYGVVRNFYRFSWNSRSESGVWVYMYTTNDRFEEIVKLPIAEDSV